MNDRGFDWDDGNISKPLTHGLTPEETEEVIYNRPLIRKTHTGRYLALGITDAGRYLVVVFEYRSKQIRIITARQMTKGERRLYARQKKGEHNYE